MPKETAPAPPQSLSAGHERSPEPTARSPDRSSAASRATAVVRWQPPGRTREADGAVHRHRRLHAPAQDRGRRGGRRPHPAARRDVHTATKAHGGEVINGTGDRCLAVFASARAGVRAAVEMQRRLAEQDTDAVAQLEVRIGLHSGEVHLPDETPHIDIHLLRRTAMRASGADVEAFSSPRLQRLMTLLALESGTTITRQRLAFQLWPESSESQARTPASTSNRSTFRHGCCICGIRAFRDAATRPVRWAGDARRGRVGLRLTIAPVSRSSTTVARFATSNAKWVGGASSPTSRSCTTDGCVAPAMASIAAKSLSTVTMTRWSPGRARRSLRRSRSAGRRRRRAALRIRRR